MIRLAPKPKPVTNKQIQQFRGETPAEKVKREKGPSSVMAVHLDGPLRCLVPIPRSDLQRGQETWTHPHRWGTVTYVLDRIEDKIHYYRWEPSE